MIIDIIIPSPGESITEVELANWFVETGDVLTKDQEIGEVESEKATLPLIAEQGGKVELLASPGDSIKVGTVVCKIDTSVKSEVKNDVPAPSNQGSEPASNAIPQTPDSKKQTSATPLAKKLMEEHDLSIEDVLSGLKKISTSEVQAVLNLGNNISPSMSQKQTERTEERKKLSQLRKKISERLVAVKNETAMLTTFNEVDMSAVMELRKKHQKKFVEKYGVKLGFMSLFTKAATIALQQYPNVNSMLDNDEIISPNYQDIGIAVQTDKGLMVPVIRDTASLSLADIENQIADLAAKARKNRIGMEQLKGGTFTITNGGVFGSMLSTPILNPPQSGILGMHNIVERPVAENGQVVIRPIMYLALSYDHRIIDGRDSVGFLKTVKSLIENPSSMLFNGQNEEALLLGINT